MSDINKLTEILNKSKAIMNRTDKEYGSVTNNMVSEQSSYEEKEIPNLTENFAQQRSNTPQSATPQGGQYRNLKTSKMPQAVLDAMVNERIDIPESPNHTFELGDVEDLINESPVQQPTMDPSPKRNVDTNNIRQIVREEIEDVVRDVIEEYLDKSLVTEDIKIKIGDTIFGGQLKPLPKKKKTKKRV
jgi:hypothetical protein|tara:strand:- start:427 stop:990 length:564 start_codon:yes stop_codon:yes gene_type:complete